MQQSDQRREPPLVRADSARAIAIAAAGILVLVLLGAAAAASAGPGARAARSVSVRDEGYLQLVRTSGSLVVDQGMAHGTIPGRVKIDFVYNGNPVVSARIWIYGRSGTIVAHGSGRLSSPTSPSPSFKGSLSITGGSGRYANAHGSGTLYGVYYRRSYAMTVQTEGTLHY